MDDPRPDREPLEPTDPFEAIDPGELRQIEAIVGLRDDVTLVSNADRCATSFFDAAGPRARGLAASRPSEISELLADGPTIVGRAPDARVLERIDADLRMRSGRFRRAVYEAVAAARGSERWFLHGRQLAERLGYTREDVDLGEAALDRFVGLANPWVFGSPAPGARVLDVGCGAGFDALLAARWTSPGGRVAGVDLTPGMARLARDQARSSGCDNAWFMNAALDELPFRSGWFDLVVANGVVMMADEIDAMLSEITRVLRPGGELRFTDLVYGGLAPMQELSDLDRWNACRTRRPLVSEWSARLVENGFVDVRVSEAQDPFRAAEERAGSWAHTFSARTAERERARSGYESRGRTRRPRLPDDADIAGPVEGSGDLLGLRDWSASVPRKPANLAEVRLDHALLLWADDHRYPILLDPRAALIWDFIDGEVTIGELDRDFQAVLATGSPAEGPSGEGGAGVREVVRQLVLVGLLTVPGVEPPTRRRVRNRVFVVGDRADRESPSRSAGAMASVDEDRPQDVVDHQPTVAPRRCLAAVLHADRSQKINVVLNRLHMSVLVEPEPVRDMLLTALAPHLTDKEARRRYSVTAEPSTARGELADRDRRFLLLTDSGLPLDLRDDERTVTATLLGHLSNLVDRQVLRGVAWFRAATLVADGAAYLVQPEFLHALPALLAVVGANRWRVLPADYAGVDPGSGEVLELSSRFASNGSSPPGQTITRHPCGGAVMVFGRETSPTPTSSAHASWSLLLLTCIGDDLRLDSRRQRLAAVQQVMRSGGLVSASAFTPTALVAALAELGVQPSSTARA